MRGPRRTPGGIPQAGSTVSPASADEGNEGPRPRVGIWPLPMAMEEAGWSKRSASEGHLVAAARRGSGVEVQAREWVPSELDLRAATYKYAFWQFFHDYVKCTKIIV